MSFETYSILKVRQAFDNADKPDPDMHWSHGTLWVDTNSEEDMDLVATTLENDVLSSDYKTSMNCLKATETEPWDQWAVDIVEA
jgi:hypothetical protein